MTVRFLAKNLMTNDPTVKDLGPLSYLKIFADRSFQFLPPTATVTPTTLLSHWPSSPSSFSFFKPQQKPSSVAPKRTVSELKNTQGRNKLQFSVCRRFLNGKATAFFNFNISG